MRSRYGVVLAAAVGLGGGCLQIVGWEEPRLDVTGTVCKPGAVADCYDGAMETVGRGICVGGKHTCKEDGTWGDCVGQVVPKAEDCSTKDDENCDGYGCGDAIWALKIENSAGRAVAVDKKTGDIYLAGDFYGTIQIGKDTFIAVGQNDVYLAKFNTTGNYLWGKQIGDVGSEIATNLVIDSDGNVVATFDVNVTGNSQIVKYDGTGKLIWNKSCGAGGKIWGVATDPQNDVIIAGNFTGTIDCGSGSLVSAGAEDILMAKLSGKDGLGVWSKKFGDAASQQARSVSVDGVGSILAVGDFHGIINFDAYKLTDTSNGSGFFLKLSPAGTVSSASQEGGTNVQSAGLFQVAVDSLGERLLAGHYSGPFAFCNGSEMPMGESYIKMLDSAGGCLWSRKLGYPAGLYKPAFDSSDNVFLLARLEAGAVDFGEGPVVGTGSGKPDIAVAKLSKTGAFVWGKWFGDIQDQTAQSIAVGPADELIMTGHFYNTLDFGTASLTAPGGGATFLAKFTP